jgi:hypothetical protein
VVYRQVRPVLWPNYFYATAGSFIAMANTAISLNNLGKDHAVSVAIVMCGESPLDAVR